MEKKIETIKFSKLVADKNNPRGTAEEVVEMASSLKSNGQLKPIDVEDFLDGTYFVTDGNRRFAGFEYIAKNDKIDPNVDCIVFKKMSAIDRLIKQVQIENQQKNWDVPNRDIAWRKIHDSLPKEKRTKSVLAKIIGTNVEQIGHFFDRQNLDTDLKKLNINSGVLQETKHLQSPEIRRKVLIYAHKKGIGAMALRQEIKVLRESSEDLIDSFTEGDLTLEQVNKLKDLPENKRKSGIATIKSVKKFIDDVPELLSKDKLKDEKVTKQHITAHEFVMKLSKEVANTVGQLEAIRSTIEYIEEESLDKYFDDKMKASLSVVLKEMQTTIKPSVEAVEKIIKKWQK